MNSIDSLQAALQQYALAEPIIAECHAAGHSYEVVRVNLVSRLRITYGAATDYVETWEIKTGKRFDGR